MWFELTRAGMNIETEIVPRRVELPSAEGDGQPADGIPLLDELHGAAGGLRSERVNLREGAIELRAPVVRGDADGDTETHAGLNPHV